MNSNPHIFMLDDEPAHLHGVQVNVEDDYEFHGYERPAEFIHAVIDHKAPAILVIDHDLNQGESLNGLHVTERIRQEHPFGLILPIIYYSAKIVSDEYVRRTAEHLLFTPNALVIKAKGGGSQDGLYAVIAAAQHMIEHVVALASEQALQQALHSPGAGPDFDLFAQEEDNEES